MKKNVLLVLLILSAFRMNAQHSINPVFIRQSEPFEFDFPQFGVGLQLPAKAGFKVPLFSGKEVMMNIDAKTIYCYNTDYLDNDKTNAFLFSLKDDKSYMELRITRLAEFNKVKIMEDARRGNGFVDVLRSLKSGLGGSLAYKVKSGKDYYEKHLFHKDGYLFTFTLKSNSEERFAYLKILEGFGEKNLRQERITYENRVKYGYYDKEKNKPTVKPDEGGAAYHKIAGRMQQTQVIDIPNMHMSMEVPAGFVYEMDGRKLTDEGNGKSVFEIEDIDLINNSMQFVWLRGKGLSAMLRYSSKKHSSPVTFSNMGSGAKQIYSFSGDTKLFTDGIETNAAYYGTPDIQHIDTWIETENGYYSYSFSNITTDNIAAYDKLLSGIKIDSEKPRNKKEQANARQLSACLDVKEKAPVEPDKLNFPKESDIETFKCHLSTIGATLWLPGKATDYKYGIRRTFGKEPLKLDAHSATPIAPDYENMFVSLYSHNGKYSVDCTLYLRYGNPATVEDMLADEVRVRPSIGHLSRINKAGVIKAADGSLWGIVMQNDSKEATVYAQNNEYLIMLTVRASGEEDLTKFCSTLYKANFKNVEPLK